jgi:ADP-dependent NAD(P)H-hydrate dehydratase / NAD(P)H-hydrate epimerase
VLSTAAQLVIDADALNAIAVDESLHRLLITRQAKAQPTIMTPHPLEAARLLGITAAQVQANRLEAANEVARRFACTVILKGSGSIIASPGQTPCINPTGDARLATAGTGDVLAGLCGALLAQSGDAPLSASQACWQHGAFAIHRPVIPASELLLG